MNPSSAPSLSLSRFFSLLAVFLCLLSTGVSQTKPTLTSKLPGGMLLEVGSPLSLAISATGNPAPTFQWRRDGVALPGQTASTLVIPAVGSVDAGKYDVVVTNSAGTRRSNATPVRVALAPATAPESGEVVLSGTYRFGKETEFVDGTFEILPGSRLRDVSAPADISTFTYRRTAPNKAFLVVSETFYDEELGATVSGSETLNLHFTAATPDSRRASFSSRGKLTAKVGKKTVNFNFTGKGNLTVVD